MCLWKFNNGNLKAKKIKEKTNFPLTPSVGFFLLTAQTRKNAFANKESGTEEN